MVILPISVEWFNLTAPRKSLSPLNLPPFISHLSKFFTELCLSIFYNKITILMCRPNKWVSVWNIEFWQKTFKSNLAKRRYCSLFHEFCKKTFKLKMTPYDRTWFFVFYLGLNGSNLLSCRCFDLPSISVPKYNQSLSDRVVSSGTNRVFKVRKSGVFLT